MSYIYICRVYAYYSIYIYAVYVHTIPFIYKPCICIICRVHGIRVPDVSAVVHPGPHILCPANYQPLLPFIHIPVSFASSLVAWGNRKCPFSNAPTADHLLPPFPSPSPLPLPPPVRDVLYPCYPSTPPPALMYVYVCKYVCVSVCMYVVCVCVCVEPCCCTAHAHAT